MSAQGERLVRCKIVKRKCKMVRTPKAPTSPTSPTSPSFPQSVSDRIMKTALTMLEFLELVDCKFAEFFAKPEVLDGTRARFKNWAALLHEHYDLGISKLSCPLSSFLFSPFFFPNIPLLPSFFLLQLMISFLPSMLLSCGMLMPSALMFSVTI